MMKSAFKTLCWYVLISMVLCSFSGNEYKLIQTINQKADYFTTDHLGNIYFINGNEIVKYNSSGNYFSRFSNKQLGNISYVDVTNPLKIVLLYRDFSQLLFLDNMLGETSSKIHLQDMQLEQTTLACGSYNNGIWLYNPINFELTRFNQEFVQTHQALFINQLAGTTVNPDFMLESGDFLYLNNPGSGIMVFDIFGTYYKTIPLKGLHTFQVIEDKIFYYNQGEMKTYHLKTMEEAKIGVPDTSARQVRFGKDRLYSLDNNGLSIFSIR